MKKKLTCLLLAMAMVFSLTACGSGGDSSGGESAEGQTYEWTASSGLAVGSSWDLGLLKFAELLNERSNGAITRVLRWDPPRRRWKVCRWAPLILS